MDIPDQIGRKLARLSKDPKNMKDYSRFTKGAKRQMHLTTPTVRKVSAEFFAKAKGLGADAILELCGEMLEKGGGDLRKVAFDWAFRIRRDYKPGYLKVFDAWLGNDVDGWGSCDDLCTRALGAFILQYGPSEKLREWARSSNMWKRRASAVSLIPSVRKGKRINEAFAIADTLMHDDEDLVQKGYGWLLKEASKRRRDEVFAYVMKNKGEMPRPALRYSIEKMPERFRERALS